jgi:hypothetical protein
MGFRFRKGLRFGPFRLNFTANGLSSVSLGGRGASLNIPVGRDGPARGTVGLPGTGLSYSTPLGVKHPSTRQRRQAQQGGSGQPTTQQIVAILQEALVGPNAIGDTLWHQHDIGLVQVLLQRDDTPRAVLEACQLVLSAIRSTEREPEAPPPSTLSLRRARQVAEAAQQVLAHGREIGIVAEDIY